MRAPRRLHCPRRRGAYTLTGERASSECGEPFRGWEAPVLSNLSGTWLHPAVPPRPPGASTARGDESSRRRRKGDRCGKLCVGTRYRGLGQHHEVAGADASAVPASATRLRRVDGRCCLTGPRVLPGRSFRGCCLLRRVVTDRPAPDGEVVQRGDHVPSCHRKWLTVDRVGGRCGDRSAQVPQGARGVPLSARCHAFQVIAEPLPAHSGRMPSARQGRYGLWTCGFQRKQRRWRGTTRRPPLGADPDSQTPR
jgi:hypothetical protein